MRGCKIISLVLLACFLAEMPASVAEDSGMEDQYRYETVYTFFGLENVPFAGPLFGFLGKVLSEFPLVGKLFEKTRLKPYLDSSLPVEVRVDDLLGRMTLEEKVGQMAQIQFTKLMGTKENEWEMGEFNPEKMESAFLKYHVGSVLSGGGYPMESPERYAEMVNHIQRYVMENSRLKIPIIYGADIVHGVDKIRGEEIYPHNIGLASTWDTELVEEISALSAIGADQVGIRWTFSPVCDVARDQRWGRVGETFGEDPYLVSQMAYSAVTGYQSEGVAACIKHYFGYSAPENGQDRSAAYVSDREIREIYLPPFRAAIDAGALTAMVNSGALNEIPMHSSEYFLNEVLRDQLGFDGLVVSDWQDFQKLWNYWGIAPSEEAGNVLGVNSGVDMCMIPINYEGFCGSVLNDARSGKISEDRIDEAVRDILTTKFRLGLFERPYAESLGKEASAEYQKKSHETALRVAEESLVLLKNDGILPLNKSTRSILVAGPMADSKNLLCGPWTRGWEGASEGEPENTVTILEGIKETFNGSEVYYSEGTSIFDPVNINETVKLAKKCDVAILAVGEPSYAEGSLFDKKEEGYKKIAWDIELPEAQLELIKAVYQTGVPTVVVLVNGRPLVTLWVAQNVPAMIEAWWPGTQGGRAVARAIAGDYNPGGKLPITIPKYLGQIPVQYDHLPGSRVEVLFPFGHGLSYTRFEYANLSISSVEHGGIKIDLDVRNIGDKEGTEIVQLYVHDVVSSILTPVKELKGFERVSLAPGESKRIEFVLPLKELTLIDRSGAEVLEPGTFEVLVGGSSENIRLKGTFDLR